MEFKQRYLSRTIRSQIVSFIAWILVSTNIIDLDSELQQQILDIIMSIVAIATQVMAVYYRIKSTKKIK